MVAKVKARPAASKVVEKPKRLTPTADVLRELYMLSSNTCAMPDCDHLIIDGKGEVVGHICHIRSALPGGARFAKGMNNEQRRDVSNLVLMCGGHHKQIDSRKYEDEYTLERVTKIKKDHEAKVRGVGSSLRQAFKSEYSDVTDKLNPSAARNFSRLERIMPDRTLEAEAAERGEQVATYVDRLSKVPDAVRHFMLAVIRRAIKLDKHDSILVHVDDLMTALDVSSGKLNTMGSALKRYSIGDLDEYSTNDGDEHHIMVRNPSEYVSWYDIDRLCDETGDTLEDFVLWLKFGLLDE